MLKSLIVFFMILTSHAFASDVVDFHSKKIIGVEILVAGKGDGLESSFGHAFLRLVGEEGDWSKDTVIGFVADPGQVYKDEKERQVVSSFKFFSGFVTGDYPISMQVSSLYDFWSHYVIREGRSIDRKIILSTPEDRQKLLENLDEMINHPEEKLGNYSFLSKNCASMILNLLTQSGFPHPIGNVLSPSSLLNYFEHSWNSPYPSMSFSTKGEADELFEKAEVNLKTDKSNDIIIKKLTSKLSELEIKKMLVVGSLDSNLRRELVKRYSFSKGVSFDQAVGVTNLPESLYQYCESSECAHTVFESIFKNQNIRLLKKILRELKIAPAPMVSEFTVTIRGEEVKQKMIHIFDSMGHKDLIKNHYDLLKDAILNEISR
jgi:hypothetical protein